MQTSVAVAFVDAGNGRAYARGVLLVDVLHLKAAPFW